MILIQRKVDLQREAQKRQNRASDVRTVITAFKRLETDVQREGRALKRAKRSF